MNTINASDNLSFQITICSNREQINNEIITSHSNILFIQKGKIKLLFPQNKNKTLNEGEIFFIPPGTNCNYKFSPNTKALILHVEKLHTICYQFFPPSIVSPQNIETLLSNTLHTTSLITNWIISVKEYIENNKYDPYLIEIKTHELLFLFKWCYPPDKIELFFAPILQEEYKFVQLILSNHSKVKTAKQLAEITNYSFPTFDKKFQKVFGVPPYKWMLQKKAEKVYREIYDTTTPLKIIADEFGFSSVSQLSDFCKRHLHLSPIMIRNQKNKGLI